MNSFPVRQKATKLPAIFTYPLIDSSYCYVLTVKMSLFVELVQG